MCADTAALSPAIKPFLDLLAQLPGLKPVWQQRFFQTSPLICVLYLSCKHQSDIFLTLPEHLMKAKYTCIHIPTPNTFPFVVSPSSPQGCEYSMNQLAKSQLSFQSGHKRGLSSPEQCWQTDLGNRSNWYFRVVSHPKDPALAPLPNPGRWLGGGSWGLAMA